MGGSKQAEDCEKGQVMVAAHQCLKVAFISLNVSIRLIVHFRSETVPLLNVREKTDYIL